MKNSDKDFVTKKDLKQLPTKKELTVMFRDLMSRMFEIFATKEDFNKLRSDNLKFQDDVLHEIVKFREDNEMIIGQRQKIEDHEERIAKLESCQLA